MKNVIILTCWALFAQILPLAAQNTIPEILQDTLVIRIEGRNQIHITAISLTELSKYERADSLKQYFFSDLEKAFEKGVFTELPQRLHYLVGKDGKRRLKAEVNSEPEKFNLKQEANRLRLDLPQYHFSVYDLRQNVQMHFYAEDSLALGLVENMRIKPALQEIAQENNKLKKHYKYTVEKQGELFISKGTEGNKLDMISAQPILGVTLIGNQLSPIFGASLKLTLHNKYSIPRYQFGLHYYGFILSNGNDFNFREVNPGTMYDLSFGINAAGKQGKEKWIGAQIGLTDKTRNNILPKHAFKSGFFMEQGAFTYSAEAIRTSIKFYEKDNSKFLYMFTVKTSF